MSNQLENEHLPLLDVNIEIDENEIDENVEFEGISPLNPPNGSSRKQSICFALAILIVFSFVLILTSCSKTLKKPLLIVISLDGCKPDYLTLGLTPTLTELTKIGFYSHLQPSFPSITFPNHVTLTSGLYPESHGIVGNSFYDPVLVDLIIDLR